MSVLQMTAYLKPLGTEGSTSRWMPVASTFPGGLDPGDENSGGQSPCAPPPVRSGRGHERGSSTLNDVSQAYPHQTRSRVNASTGSSTKDCAAVRP
jgi:hypothetical protein